MKKYELFVLNKEDIKFTGKTITGLMKKVEDGNRYQAKPLKSKFYWKLEGMLACLCTLNIDYEILCDDSDIDNLKMTGIIIGGIEFKVGEEE